jgi:O-methyltransferase
MTWKDRVNTGLVRLTGYELTRSARGSRSRLGTARNPHGAAAPTATRQVKAKRAKSAAATFPKDFDADAVQTIEAVAPWTMTSPEKLNALILAVRHVVKRKIPGDIVECGVWRGGSMQATARTLIESGDTSRHLYLFDTFEGMPPPTEEDRRHDGQSAAELLAANDRSSGVWAVASLEDVQDGMSHVPYPDDQVHYVAGLVEDTVPDKAPEQISVLRLDTDWYASTKHELDTLYSRLVPGGVLLIDDYGWWQGSRKAVDEFLEETGEQLLLLRMAEGRIAVKP